MLTIFQLLYYCINEVVGGGEVGGFLLQCFRRSQGSGAVSDGFESERRADDTVLWFVEGGGVGHAK